MLIIPVLDIRSSHVVGALSGQREYYRPLESKLAASSHPETVLRALLDLYPFDTIYVADLDAIERRGDNLSMLRALGASFPSLSFWVDAGFTDQAAVDRWRAVARVRPVIGSESHRRTESLRSLLSSEAEEPPILSLDFHNGAFRGPPEVLAGPWRHPTAVILMDLDRIGTDLGPNVSRLEHMRAQAPHTSFYVAGGTRHAADLLALAAAGAAGTLIATALHSGRLKRHDLRRIAQFVADQ